MDLCQSMVEARITVVVAESRLAPGSRARPVSEAPAQTMAGLNSCTRLCQQGRRTPLAPKSYELRNLG